MSAGSGPVVVIRQSRGLLVWSSATVALVVAMLLTDGGATGVLGTMALFTGTLAAVLTAGRGCILLDAAGLVVRRPRRKDITYRWHELLDVGWFPGGSSTLPGPVVRPAGGPFDDPGPNNPARIVGLAIMSPGRARRARRDLRATAEANGVPWVDEAMSAQRRWDLRWRRPDGTQR